MAAPPAGGARDEARAGFAAWVEREVAPHAARWDREAHTPPEAIRRLAATGWLGGIVAPEHGGAGMDWVSFAILCEELGRACSSLRSLVTVHAMTAFAVQRWGSAAQRARWLPALAAGTTLGAFGLSEPGAGSDVGSVATTAEPDGAGGYLLRGQKSWTTYGRVADLFLVVARAAGQPVALLVEAGTPGLTVEPLEGVTGTRASMLATLRLEGCRVPGENRLGGAGFGVAVALSALEVGRLSVAAGCTGIVRACLDASLAYAAGRRQFGVPIGEHQLVQRMIADMATGWRAARLLALQAAALRDAGSPEAGMESFVAKYFASTAATRAALDAVQIHGANGCTDRYPVERYLRDSRVMEIIEGSTQIQQVTIAAHELRNAGGAG
jgi:alkylation response protein AidB-like acyl-CoA dehydrogenase